MKQLSRAGESFTGPRAKPALAISHDNQPRSDSYNCMLYKIADCFGFSNTEAEELVRTTHGYVRSYKSDQGSLSYRVWLAKVLVQQCVFRISSELFGQVGSSAEKKHTGLLDYYYRYRTPSVQHLHQMPLSFRAVYILSQLIGFTATEVADIVNAPLFTVKERYYKAQAFLLAQGQGDTLRA
jgi:hypothetical protein